MVKNIWISRETGISYLGYNEVVKDYTKLMLRVGELGGQEVPSASPGFSKIYFAKDSNGTKFLEHYRAEASKKSSRLEVIFIE